MKLPAIKCSCATLILGLALSTCLLTGLRAETTPTTPTATTSESELPRFAIGAEVGSAGFGPAVLLTMSKHFTANIGYTMLSYSYNFSSDTLDYNGKLKFSNLQAIINWHPMAGAFRISAGAFLANNKIAGNIKANAVDGYDFNHTAYSKSEISSVGYNVELTKGAAPYVGFGWSKNPAKKGFGFFADIGVMFMKSPTTTITPYTTAAITAARATQLKKDVIADQNQANDDLSSFKYYPIIQLGLMYRF